MVACFGEGISPYDGRFVYWGGGERIEIKSQEKREILRLQVRFNVRCCHYTSVFANGMRKQGSQSDGFAYQSYRDRRP